MAMIRSIAQGRPAKCADRIVHARGVMAASGTWINVLSQRVHVSQYRRRANTGDGVDLRAEIQRRSDDLTARLGAGSHHPLGKVTAQEFTPTT